MRFVEKAIEDLRNGPCVFSSRLLWVSEHGDLADFQGFLTPVFENRADSDRPDPMARNDLCLCMLKCGDLIEKIAELGRCRPCGSSSRRIAEQSWEGTGNNVDDHGGFGHGDSTRGMAKGGFSNDLQCPLCLVYMCRCEGTVAKSVVIHL